VDVGVAGHWARLIFGSLLVLFVPACRHIFAERFQFFHISCILAWRFMGIFATISGLMVS